MKKITSYINQFNILLLFVVCFVISVKSFVDFNTETISLEIDYDDCNDIEKDIKDLETEEFTLEPTNTFFFFDNLTSTKNTYNFNNTDYKDFYLDFFTPPPEKLT